MSDLPDVDVFTVGTVGEPGQRIFYLQARTGSHVVSLKVEKQQVAALAEALVELLADLPPVEATPVDLDLIEPVEPDWVVGAMAITPWDEETERVTLVAQEAVGEDDPPGESVRFTLRREQLAAIVRRGQELVEAGRPPCQFCGRPLDPTGHVCPRSNGKL